MEFNNEFSLVTPVTPKKRLSIFARKDDNDESTDFSGFISPKLEKQLLKESRGSKSFASPLGSFLSSGKRGSLLSPGKRDSKVFSPGKRDSKIFSPVSSVANVLRSSFRESFVKRSPMKDDEDEDEDEDEESDSEEEDSDDEEEVNEDDSDSEGEELEKDLKDEELLLLVCREFELMGDDGG
jgi:hypothetical protein